MRRGLQRSAPPLSRLLPESRIREEAARKAAREAAQEKAAAERAAAQQAAAGEPHQRGGYSHRDGGVDGGRQTLHREWHQAVDPEGAYADYFVMCVRTGGPGAKGLFYAPGAKGTASQEQTSRPPSRLTPRSLRSRPGIQRMAHTRPMVAASLETHEALLEWK